MSNVQAPHGFKPVRYLNGSPWNGQAMPYQITSGYATSIFQYDVVKFISTGLINAAAAGDQPRGIFVGVTYTDTTGRPQRLNYWPASTTTLNSVNPVVWIVDDPNIIMEVQLANSSSAATQANMGELCNLFAGTGVTQTGLSAEGLDFSSTATSGRTFRLLRFVDRQNNDTASAYSYLEVGFATHDFKVTTGI